MGLLFYSYITFEIKNDVPGVTLTVTFAGVTCGRGSNESQLFCF